jgi:antitoxin component of MazEF toxin-antitoxin module
MKKKIMKIGSSKFVLLDRYVCKTLNLEVGDELTIKINEEEKTIILNK